MVNSKRDIANVQQMIVRLRRGPSMHLPPHKFHSLTPAERKELEEEMQQAVKIWAETWIVPGLHDLLPPTKAE